MSTNFYGRSWAKSGGGNHLPTVAVRWHHMFSVTSQWHSFLSSFLCLIWKKANLYEIWPNNLWCSSFAKKSKGGITSSSEGGIFRGHALWFLMNLGTFWRWRFHSCYIDSSNNPKQFCLCHFFIFYKFFWKNKGVNFVKWLINKTFLMPSVEQLLGCQIDSWTSKNMEVGYPTPSYNKELPSTGIYLIYL